MACGQRHQRARFPAWLVVIEDGQRTRVQAAELGQQQHGLGRRLANIVNAGEVQFFVVVVAKAYSHHRASPRRRRSLRAVAASGQAFAILAKSDMSRGMSGAGLSISLMTSAADRKSCSRLTAAAFTM